MVMSVARVGVEAKRWVMAFSSTVYRVGSSCQEMLLSRLRCGGLRAERGEDPSCREFSHPF